MEDTDYAKVKNIVSKPKKRIAGEKLRQLPSDEEWIAQFNTARNRKQKKTFLHDCVKQSSYKNQNINKSQKHNQTKGRLEQGLIQQAESEA
jgi:hypothetical protein